jgi:peptidyl-prolyl cis-trans isomerase SurA
MRLCLTVTVALTAVVLRCGAAVELNNYIAAIVNDSVITYEDVQEANWNPIQALERMYYNQPEVLREKRAKVMNEGLEQLLARQLILDEFKKAGGAIPENWLDDQIKERVRRQFVDRVRMTQTLQKQGITTEKFRKRLHDDLVVQLMTERNVRSAIIISPQKIEKYYSEHIEQYKQGNEIKLRTIVLNEKTAPTMVEVKRIAHEIAAKLEGGASFKEMASVYSEGTQRREGGDWGWIERKLLRKGLSDVAFSLEAGQRSGVIGFAPIEGSGYSIYRYNKDGQLIKVSKYSDKDDLLEEKDFINNLDAAAGLPEPQEYHLMLVEDKRSARTKNITEVKDEIEKELLSQERRRLYDQWVKRLKEKALVRYMSF